MSLSLENIDESENEASGDHEFRQVLLQQSVTMLAYMDRTMYNGTVATGMAEPRTLLRFFVTDLPILIGAAVGTAVLILIVLAAVIMWQCCKLNRQNDKAYCLDNSCPDDTFVKQCDRNIIQSDSVVFFGSKSNQVSTHAIGIMSDAFETTLTRSQSVSFHDQRDNTEIIQYDRSSYKKRPNSQPVPVSNVFSPVVHTRKKNQSIYPHYFQNQIEGTDHDGTFYLPSIPEVASKYPGNIHDALFVSLYASCNALDGTYAYSSLYSTLDSTVSMKTQSLPSGGRSRPRPLSTEDDLNELYAKVNFSKKRKNRMRSDSAAAIAMNKSRSTYMTLPYAHKDTDSLVDNEAVVVYDERTAL